MRFALLLFCLLAPFVFLSCSDGDSVDAPSRFLLTKARVSNPKLTFDPMDFAMEYNKEGRLLRTQPNGTLHEYDEQGRLTKVLWNGQEEVLTYDGSGRLASTYTHDPTYTDHTWRYTFSYGDSGRPDRILEDVNSGGRFYLFLLSYDQAGNVRKVERFVPDASGSPLSKAQEVEASFDANPNPMRGVGLVGYYRFYYGPLLHTYIGPNDRFITFLSPNNPTRLKITTFRWDLFNDPDGEVPILYKYNEAGYPMEVTAGDYTFELEYTTR